MSLSDFVITSLFSSLILLAVIYIPTKLMGAWRRKKRRNIRLSCRLCGYRFLFKTDEPQAHCPHCQARNKG